MMFKKYAFKWKDQDGTHTLDFFVHDRGTRGGFQHRACAVGHIPRLDEKGDYGRYTANTDALFKKRVHKVSYLNRTWECFPGQYCLARLWDKIAKLKFVDMGRVSPLNPFSGEREPPHDELYEPDVLFGGFNR